MTVAREAPRTSALLEALGVTRVPSDAQFLEDVRYFAHSPDRVRALAKFSGVAVSTVRHWLLTGSILVTPEWKIKIVDWITKES